MKITKVLETRIDVNISDMFCPDYDKRILHILKDKYINRCFKSIYIIDIDKIIRRSGLNGKNKELDGSAYIDISFEVQGIVYEKGDIIHNCKIIQINDNGTMHAKSEHTSIYIKNSNDIVIFKESDEISVIVRMARYNLYDTEISISSIPFIPILKNSIIYKIADDTKLDISDFNNIAEDVLKLENTVKGYIKSHKAIFKFFKDLIYPYKAVKKINYGKSYDIILDNLLKLEQNEMFYKPDSYLDDNTYLLISESDQSKIETLHPTTSVFEINKREFVMHIYSVYRRNLIQLIEFLENYNTKDKIQLSKSSWALYNVFKK